MKKITKKLLAISLGVALLISAASLQFTGVLANSNRLARPGIPTAAVTGNGRIRVNYRQMRGSNRAQIQIRRVGARNWRTVNINLRNVTRNTARNRVIRDLSNERYQVRVRARRVADGRTVNSNWSPVRTFRLRPTAPARPTVSVSGNTATLRWTRVTGATGYRVQRRVGTGSWTTAVNVGSNVTSRNFTLSATNAYSFRIIALGRGGNSAPAPAITEVRAQVVTQPPTTQPPTTQPPTTQPPTTPPTTQPSTTEPSTPGHFFNYAEFFEFHLINGVLTPVAMLRITGYVGSAANVVIPSNIGGRPVAEVYENAFLGNTVITSLVIPSSLRFIGSNAFANMPNLRALTMPPATFVHRGALRGTSGNLQTLNGVPTPDDFEFCFNLGGAEIAVTRYTGTDANVEVPQSIGGRPVTAIGAGTFALRDAEDEEELVYNPLIQSVVIPQGVQTIEVVAFWGNINLSSVTLPNTLTSIGRGAFHTTTSLASITLPDSLIHLGSEAFRNSGLESIEIPGGVNYISTGTFMDASNLKVVRFNHEIYWIEENAFKNTPNIERIYIPSHRRDFWMERRAPGTDGWDNSWSGSNTNLEIIGF